MCLQQQSSLYHVEQSAYQEDNTTSNHRLQEATLLKYPVLDNQVPGMYITATLRTLP